MSDPSPNYFNPVSPELPRTKTAGGMILEMFPPGFIALNKELATGLHPGLEVYLQRHSPEDTDLKLAEVAVHCGILLDGIYSLEEKDKLCFVMAGRLELLREVPKGTIIL